MFGRCSEDVRKMYGIRFINFQTEKLNLFYIYFFLFAMFVDREFENVQLYYHIMSYAHASSNMDPYKEQTKITDVIFPVIVTYDKYRPIQFDFDQVVYRFFGYRKKYNDRERGYYSTIIKHISLKLLKMRPIESGQKMIPMSVPMEFRSDKTAINGIRLIGPSIPWIFSEVRSIRGLMN